MAKIGRNEMCPCGSKKKYKKCCVDLLKKKTVRQVPMTPGMELAIERQKAAELQRQQQQGLGRPIISGEFKNHRIVAVGGGLVFSPEAKTFPDILIGYLPNVMGKEWSANELKKDFATRHPIFQWHEVFCQLQKKIVEGSTGEIFSMKSTGVVYCFLGLAYNLYLIQHNVELQERFIKRLKDINNFQGAYYELIVAGCLIVTGFWLELEDETDDESKHCEFSAISKKTGKKYWVEAKARSVMGVLGKPRASGSQHKDPTSRMSKHISKAFKKPADSDRLIFVDLNAPGDSSKGEPDWLKKAWKRLDAKERDLKSDEAAYVFITNMNFHHHLTEETRSHCILAHGLGIPDFGKKGWVTFKDKYKQKKKHIDAHNIMGGFRDYPNIPSTFDGSLPSESFDQSAQPVKIGEKYFFDNVGDGGVVATVTTATVNETEKTVYFGTDKGHILGQKISDAELADYKSHRETYFGVIQWNPRPTKDSYEFFENLVEIHMPFTWENMVSRIETFAEAEQLKKLSHEELVLTYCERLVADLGRAKS